MATTRAAKVKTSDFDDAPARDARIFLIDGSSLAFRSFFALPQEIATSDGRPTNALLGFSNMLLKLLADYRPETVIVAWDLGGETVRKRAYSQYKAQRPEMPELLSKQWPHFPALVEAFGFVNVSLPEYEADDVIGTLALQAQERGIKTCIVTYDRDAMQLVSDRVVVMMTTKGVSEVSVFTPERVHARFGVTPEQIPDMMGLRGDTSDNIPGVPGIGEKTAADLVTRFGSLERVLESIDDVGGVKRRENLREHADQARMSKDLATIVCDLPLAIDLDVEHARTPDRSRLAELMRTFEFRTLARRVEELAAAPASAAGSDAPPVEESVTVPADALVVAARTVSVQELSSLVAAMPDGEGVSLAVRPVEGVDESVVSVAVLMSESAPESSVRNVFVALVRGAAGPIAQALTGRDVTAFDYKSLPDPFIDRHQLHLVDDALILSYLLDPSRRTLLAGEIAAEHGARVRVAWSGDDPQLVELGTLAAQLPTAVASLRSSIESLGMLELYETIELPLVDVLVDVERVGVCIDEYRLAEIAHKVTDQLEELRDRAHKLAGEEFNLSSPQQLATVLFERLGLPAQRKGKTGYSTDARVLRDLRDLHPIIEVIEQNRELSKLKNTYLDVLPGLVNRRTGRVHTTFSQVTAATGRLSSINPNLQNIPVRTAIGREIRSAFIPADGCRFVSCDYSQVELRLLAHVSGEPKLIETFVAGDDVHTSTAAEIAGVEPSQVTREQRSAAKAVNFGIIYGISSFGLAAQLQISREEAQGYIDRYFGRYPYVQGFIERTIEQAREDGCVTTLFGRRRPIGELRSRSHATRQLGERLAVNTILQGTAADIMKIAMVRAHHELAGSGLSARIVLQIHDELLIEAPADEVQAATRIVRDAMVGAFDMDPPLAVDSGVGVNWFDAK